MSMDYRSRIVMTLSRAVSALGFVLLPGVSATAGSIDDATAAYARGDYATFVTKFAGAPASEWLAIREFAARAGDTLYGEIAKAKLALVRPDASQAVAAPSWQSGGGRSSYRVLADAPCRLALSFHNDQREPQVRLWSMPQGRLIATVSAPFGVSGGAVSSRYVAIQGSNIIHFHDSQTASFTRSIEGFNPGRIQIASLYFSQDGKQLLVIPQLLPEIVLTGRLFDIASGAELPAQGITPLPTSPQPVNAGDLLRAIQDSPPSDCPVARQPVFAQ
jgi:hypothetical protein